MKRLILQRRNEKGVALIFALVLVLVLSVIAASLLFVSRTEIWASSNYRMMTQARYGAEAGINSAANYLINSYTPPGTTGPDQYSNYTQLSPNTAAVPVPGSAMFATVEYNGNLVALASGNPSVPFTYSYQPGAGVRRGFTNNVAGTIQSGNDTVSYSAYATLLSMEQLSVYGSSTPVSVQTWLLTADGNINSVQNSQVEVSAVLEQKPVPTFQYAVFGTSQGCGALNFSGGGSTASYDSAALNNGNPVVQNNSGNVGSNGNLNEAGAPTTINGTMSTPSTGVGPCGVGGNVDAWSDQGNAHVTGGLVQLPQIVSYPTPTVPPPGILPVTVQNTTTELQPGSYQDISVGAKGTLELVAGCTYDINSLSMTSANATITIISDPNVCGGGGPVVLNISGTTPGDLNDSNPLILQGNGIANPSYVAGNLQIVYAGTGELDLRSAQTQMAAVVYAPNAAVKVNGNGSWFGSVIGNTVNDTGGAAIVYDRHLQKQLYTLGNWELDSFTWKKY